MVWIFGVGEYLQRFLLEHHQSFLFSVSYWGNRLLHNDHSLPHLRQLRWVSHYTMFSDVFFVIPCFHWVATRELRLITLWNAPTSLMFCYFGGRFFVGAPSFLFSLVRSTIVIHFWSAHLFYFVDFLKNISLAIICTVYMIGSRGPMAAIGFRILSPKQTQLQHLPPANCSEPPPRIHSFCVVRLYVACRFPPSPNPKHSLTYST